MKLTVLKRTIQRYLAHSQGCVAIASSSKTCHPPPKGTLCHQAVTLLGAPPAPGHPLSDDDVPALGVSLKGILHCDLRIQLLSLDVMFSRSTGVREHATPFRGGTVFLRGADPPVMRAAVNMRVRVRVRVGAPAVNSGSCSVLC